MIPTDGKYIVEVFQNILLTTEQLSALDLNTAEDIFYLLRDNGVINHLEDPQYVSRKEVEARLVALGVFQQS